MKSDCPENQSHTHSFHPDVIRLAKQKHKFLFSTRKPIKLKKKKKKKERKKESQTMLNKALSPKYKMKSLGTFTQ